LADDHLWAEVLNLGGYDVLAKPFDGCELFRALSSAWWANEDPLSSTAVEAPAFL
jgi:DNA-binding response OmpR family regulator